MDSRAEAFTGQDLRHRATPQVLSGIHLRWRPCGANLGRPCGKRERTLGRRSEEMGAGHTDRSRGARAPLVPAEEAGLGRGVGRQRRQHRAAHPRPAPLPACARACSTASPRCVGGGSRTTHRPNRPRHSRAHGGGPLPFFPNWPRSAAIRSPQRVAAYRRSAFGPRGAWRSFSHRSEPLSVWEIYHEQFQLVEFQRVRHEQILLYDPRRPGEGVTRVRVGLARADAAEDALDFVGAGRDGLVFDQQGPARCGGCEGCCAEGGPSVQRHGEPQHCELSICVCCRSTGEARCRPSTQRG